ncbi:hypothetical protein LINGRAHAP2_LOCUS35597 [Linum grandiflorum]
MQASSEEAKGQILHSPPLHCYAPLLA